jgi:DNA transformation protein and related proteins
MSKPASQLSSGRLSKQLSDQLGDLPGLGPRSSEMLHSAGITSVQQLRQLGSVVAFHQVQATGLRPSLNLLWALEGALTGEHWQRISREHRTSLLLALDALAEQHREVR